MQLGIDCAVQVQLPVTVKRGTTYDATIDLNATGNTAQRKITLVGPVRTGSRSSDGHTPNPPHRYQPPQWLARRGARAVESGGLENRWAQGPVGSNPTPAASTSSESASWHFVALTPSRPPGVRALFQLVQCARRLPPPL